MIIINGTVTGQRLSLDRTVVATGITIGQLKLSFSPEWDGYVKAAVFFKDKDKPYRTLFNDNGVADIPSEVANETGTCFIGAFGTLDNKVITTEAIGYNFRMGAITKDLLVPDPTPDIYAQLLSAYNTLGGAITDERLKIVCDSYIANHPDSIRGATTEQVSQISKNASDIDLIKKDTEKFKTTEEKLKNLQEEVAKIKSEGVDGVLNENDVKNAVDKYLESNTIDGLFSPNNLVLYEEVGDEDSTPITATDIIAEVLAQLELKSIGGYKLGLYMGDVLIDSIVLDEFKANEIICTGLMVSPAESTVYGKATIELITTAAPLNCTQKVRWFSGDETMASVQNGTVQMTGKSGTVSIMAVCGNYRATANITVEQYVYTDFDWQIGLISETVGGVYSRSGDSQNMRISSAYIATPVDTEIIMTGGDSYRYSIYYYKDGKLTAPCTSWAVCSAVITIKADEYDGFAIKVMRKSYVKWDDTYIEAFAKTISIQSV